MGLYRSIIGNKLRIAQPRNVQNRKWLGERQTPKIWFYAQFSQPARQNLMWTSASRLIFARDWPAQERRVTSTRESSQSRDWLWWGPGPGEARGLRNGGEEGEAGEGGGPRVSRVGSQPLTASPASPVSRVTAHVSDTLWSSTRDSWEFQRSLRRPKNKTVIKTIVYCYHWQYCCHYEVFWLQKARRRDRVSRY